MIQFRSNIQTAEFGFYQIYKHSASPRVYKADINLLRGLYKLYYLEALKEYRPVTEILPIFVKLSGVWREKHQAFSPTKGKLWKRQENDSFEGVKMTLLN